jgi:hypothetical protein
MTEPDGPLSDRLRARAETFEPQAPALDDIRRKGTRRRWGRRAGIGLGSVVILAGVLGPLGLLSRLDDAPADTGPAGATRSTPTSTLGEAPTARSIMQDGQPVGAELAAELGLELMDGFDHQCQYYVEVENSGAGYCLEGLSTTDTADLYVIAEALQGIILTPEELASFKASGGTQDIASDAGALKGYASPPDSGYWVLFPDAPQPVGTGSDMAVRIVALTNLPDGTLFLVNTDRSGMCCAVVTDGQMIIEASAGACDKVSGAHGQGMSITITVSADIGQHVFGVPVGGQPPQQPDSVLAILGARFENLTGKQVVDKGGEMALVASSRYVWPEPLCLD